MSDVVIVLALVAIMIINSVRKSKAMRKRSDMTRQENSPVTHEFDSFIGKDERIWQEVENNHYPSVRQTVGPGIPQQKKKIRKKKAVETAASVPVDDSVGTAGSGIQTDDKEFEFDLRRAVIESEILNPKFKQY